MIWVHIRSVIVWTSYFARRILGDLPPPPFQLQFTAVFDIWDVPWLYRYLRMVYIWLFLSETDLYYKWVKLRESNFTIVFDISVFPFLTPLQLNLGLFCILVVLEPIFYLKRARIRWVVSPPKLCFILLKF